MMMSSAGQATGCATKPLVINHALNSEIKLSSNQTSERSIIPSLSSQLIYSSIITNTKTKSSNTTTSNATLSRQQVSQPTLSPAKTTLVVGSKRSASTTSSSELATSPTLEGLNAIVRSNGGCTKLQVPYPTNFVANTTSPIAAGQAVSAKLIDMGKKLLEAARAGMVDDVRQLVVNSGAPFTSDWLGTTALHLAAQHGHAEITEILLRGGVNRDARTKLERTALHLAAQGGHLEVVDLLLMHGSDVNARDMLKMTPLHWAVERNHVCVVEKLLFCGADAQAKSKFQLTPIEIAHNSPSYEMLELFKSWTTNKDENLNAYGELDINEAFSHESHDALDVDYHLSIENTATTSRTSMLDINEPCIDLVELEWNALKFEPDFFLSNDDEEEPRVEYLMKIVEELQKENRQLRKRVEQLSTACR